MKLAGLYLAGLFALACAVTGCQTRLDAPYIDDGYFVSARTRFAIDAVGWDQKLTDAQRTVTVHPSDGGPGLGSVKLDPDGTASATRLGASGALGNKWVRIFIGSDLRYNGTTSDDADIGDHDDDGDIEFRNPVMRDIERQPLPSNFNSYGYTMIETGDYSVIPYIGLEVEIANAFLMTLEAGAPRTKFRYDRGHYRNGAIESVERSTWEGYGRSYGATIGARLLDNRGFFGLQYNYEIYDAEFSNIDTEIDAHVIGLLFSLRF